MIRTFVSIALLAAVACTASAAEPQPKLKELVTVTADVVRIGDLVDRAGAAADIAVFRAPDLGQTGAVPVARVTEALQAHDLAGLDTGNLSEVVVTRLSRAVSPQDFQERIARAFAGRQGLGDADTLAVTFDREVRPVQVEANATADFTVSRMSLDPRSGRYDINLDLPGSEAARRLSLRFTGTVTETVETATLTRSVARGEVLRASDILVERRPKADVGGEPVAAERAVGMSAKAAMRAGQTLRLSQLMKSDVVQRGDAVTIFYEAPGVVLTVRGKALDVGAIGDTIGVTNIQSNRNLQATVDGPGRVTISGMSPVVAALAAPSSSAFRRQQ
jgi:flagella basal body P-ring formation protein FlgA